MRNRSARDLAILLAIVVLVYWRILFTHQFTMLVGTETINQAYSWFTFWIRTIRSGSLPLWDSYAFSGRAFPGEMQTGAFYPLYFPLLLFRLDRWGLLAPALYHWSFVVQHIVAAWFMYGLVVELNLNRWAGLMAACCFTFGGLTGTAGWPHIVASAIWFPAILMLLLRALRIGQELTRKASLTALTFAALAGLCLGMSILAGGLHITMMQGVAVISFVLFWIVKNRMSIDPNRRKQFWVSPALILAALLVTAGGSGAVQLLSSHEYSARTIRFVGAAASPSNVRIPYAYVDDGVSANNAASALFPANVNSNFGGSPGTELWKLHIGVFGFLMALVAVWKRWQDSVVQFSTWMAGLSFAYSLGGPSLLHGLAYILVPYLWMAREASRSLYLAGFALALLAAYGLDAVLDGSERFVAETWTPARRWARWVLTSSLILIAASGSLQHFAMSNWAAFSFLMIVVACALFLRLTVRPESTSLRVLVIAAVCFDLSAFMWNSYNIIENKGKGLDQLETLRSLKGAADFLKTRPLPFRARVVDEARSNIGDAYGIGSTGGGGVTFQNRYLPLLWHDDLLNVRYSVKHASVTDPGAIFADKDWKVYENPTGLPHAWVVHESLTLDSDEQMDKRVGDGSVDLRRTALVRTQLPARLERLSAPEPAVSFEAYDGRSMTMTAQANGAGLLVLNELFYPGWQAEVNGRPATLIEVDGPLDGIALPAGESRVTLRYRPTLIYTGLAVSVLTFLGVLGWALWFIRFGRQRNNLLPS